MRRRESDLDKNEPEGVEWRDNREDVLLLDSNEAGLRTSDCAELCRTQWERRVM